MGKYDAYNPYSIYCLTYPEGGHLLGYLVVVIHGLALVVVWFALFSLAKVEIEHALAKITDDNATKELERIKGGERGRIPLDHGAFNSIADRGLQRLGDLPGDGERLAFTEGFH